MTALAWHSTDPAVHAVHDAERGVYLMVDCPPPGDEPRHIFSVRAGADAHSPAVVIGSVHERDLETAKRVAEAVAAVVAQGGGEHVDCPAPGDEPWHIFSVRDGDGAHSPAVVIGIVHERDLETAKRVAEAVAGVVAQGGGEHG